MATKSKNVQSSMSVKYISTYLFVFLFRKQISINDEFTTAKRT